MNKIGFLKTAIADKKVGAIARSSGHLIKEVLKRLPKKPLHVIIECGPGDGIMTRELLKLLPSDGRLVAIESNKEFIEVLESIGDHRLEVINGKMEEVIGSLERRGLKEVDLIISSIPFSWLSQEKREEVLTHSSRLLRKDGSFVAFHQYVPVVASSLKNFFKQVEISFVFRNVFPCFIITAKMEPGFVAL